MSHGPLITSLGAFRLLLVGLAAGALVGCGGGDESTSASGITADAQSSFEAQSSGSAPLFDSAGQPLPSAATLVPTDGAARTRSGLYATRAQFEWQTLTLQPYTVLVDVDVDGSEQAAVAKAELARSAPGVAWFVRSREPALASAVADRLTLSGLSPVFVVR